MCPTPLFSQGLSVVPNDLLKEFPENTQTHTKTFSGLPVGASGMLVDNMFQVFSPNGFANQASTVQAFKVPKGGSVTISGLRDSVYSLIITTPGLARFNQFGITVGDPDRFNTINQSPDPQPAQITSVDAALDNEVPFATVNWALSARGETGTFRIDYKISSTSVWSIAKDNIGQNERSYTITPLEYNKSYSFRIALKTTDNTEKTLSDVVLITTPESPADNVTWSGIDNLPSGILISTGSGIRTEDTAQVITAEHVPPTDNKHWAIEPNANKTQDHVAADTSLVNSVAAATVEAASTSTRNIWTVALEGSPAGNFTEHTNTTGVVVYMYKFFYTYAKGETTVVIRGQVKRSGGTTGNISAIIENMEGTGGTLATANSNFTNTGYTGVDFVINTTGLTENVTYLISVGITDDGVGTTYIKGGTGRATF